MKTLVTYAKVRAVTESGNIEILLSSVHEIGWDYLGVEVHPSESVLWFKLSDSNHSVKENTDADIKALQRDLMDLANQLDVPISLECSIEPERNWNEQWEAGIEPFQCGSFWITPPWSEKQAPRGSKRIVIHPKMSFGTGSHETTQLMLSMLEELDLEGVYGIDAGTGTGILSVASILLGAKSMIGFDIDSWSVSNAIETANLNGVESQVDIQQGGFECLEALDRCDVLLANIHTRVLLDGANAFIRACKSNAPLLLSGMLVTDEAIVKQHYETLGCTICASRKKNDWVALHVECPST